MQDDRWPGTSLHHPWPPNIVDDWLCSHTRSPATVVLPGPTSWLVARSGHCFLTAVGLWSAGCGYRCMQG